MSDFEDIPLAVDDAVAALRWGAASEQAPSGAHESAVEAVLGLTAGPDGRIPFEQVLAAIRKHVPEAGAWIHGREQAPGSSAVFDTNWAIEDAIQMAREPDAMCAWTSGAYYHDLRVIAADGTTAWFHAFCPERYAGTNPQRRTRILDEIASYAAQEGRPDATAPDDNAAASQDGGNLGAVTTTPAGDPREDASAKGFPADVQSAVSQAGAPGARRASTDMTQPRRLRL